MRIAVLAHAHHPISEPFSGGLEMHTALIADELVARGHDVTLFAKEGSVSRAKVVPIVSADFRHRHMLDETGADRSQKILDRSAAYAIDLIAAGGFDVVLNNALGALPYLLMADQPMLTMLHTPTLAWVLDVITRPGWAPSDNHVYAAVSEYTATDWRTVLPDVRCIHNGIDRSRWRPSLQVRPQPGLAVWSARITPEKGLHIAIDAARRAGLRLAIGGPIADREYFDTAVAPRLGGDVRYLGHLDHQVLPDFLRRGEVFLSSPQWEEPFGLAMVEAMAVGTPVAALPRGAAGEIVGTRGGVIALEDSVEELAYAARAARRLDRRAVVNSVVRFDKNTMTDAYETILRDLAEGRSDLDLDLAELPA